MKIMKILLTISILFFAMVSMGWCLTINDPRLISEGGNAAPYGVEVGELDSLIGYISQDDFIKLYNIEGVSADQAEANWAAAVIGGESTVSFDTKTEDVDYWRTNYVDESTKNYTAFAFEITPTPPISEWFIIKNSTFRALYVNNVEYDWGVFNTAEFTATDELAETLGAINLPTDDFQISHVTRLDSAPVPEPATMLLLGTGLVGLAVTGRKKFKK